MKKIESLLHDCLYNNGTTLFRVYQEYCTNHDTKFIVENDEDGLDILFEGYSAYDIALAICNGNYSPSDEYVKMTAFGNVESFDYIEDNVDITSIVKWLLTHESDTKGAWEYIEYDDILDLPLHFKEEFACDFGLNDDDVDAWYEDYENGFEHIIITPWDELKEEFDAWMSNKPKPQMTKEEIFEEIKNILKTYPNHTMWFYRYQNIMQFYYGSVVEHTLISLRLGTTRDGNPIIFQDADVSDGNTTIREIDDITHLSLEEMTELYEVVKKNM